MPPHSTPCLLTAGGAVILAACVTLAVTVTPLGSPLFFSMTAIAAVAYVLVLRHVWSGPDAPGRWLLLALAFAVAFRAPLALTPVGADNDMVRYLWDGRVQRLGYNPYLVVPADPSLAGTHTEQTR